jgi:uncharacterized cupin superfamily protein
VTETDDGKERSHRQGHARSVLHSSYLSTGSRPKHLDIIACPNHPDMMSDRQVNVDHTADTSTVDQATDIGAHESAHIPEEGLFLSDFMEEWREL